MKYGPIAITMLWLSASASGDLIYITDFGDGTIKRANLDGSGFETVLSGLDYPVGLAIDSRNRKIYWTENDFEPRFHTSTISRANLDGTGVEQLLEFDFNPTMSSTPRAITLDVGNGRMFLADATDYGHSGRITQATLDGTNDQLLRTYSWPNDISIDAARGKLYWSDFVHGNILRSNLDGSDSETVIAAPDTRGFAIDTSNEKLYYNERAVIDGVSYRKIMAANLDGTEPQELLTLGTDYAADEATVHGMAIDFDGDKLYWVNYRNSIVQRSNLDGSQVEDVISGGFVKAERIAIFSENAAIPEPSAFVSLSLLSVLGLLSLRRWI